MTDGVIEAQGHEEHRTVGTLGERRGFWTRDSQTLPAAAELPSVNLEFRAQTGCHERIAGEHRLDAGTIGHLDQHRAADPSRAVVR
jgi:hypothetical protein